MHPDDEQDVPAAGPGSDKILASGEELVYWPPSFLEIDSLVTGKPIEVAVWLTDGTCCME